MHVGSWPESGEFDRFFAGAHRGVPDIPTNQRRKLLRLKISHTEMRRDVVAKLLTSALHASKLWQS